MRPNVTLADWQTPEHVCWSFRHTRELIPTARVSRGPTASPLEPAPPGVATAALTPVIDAEYTDAVVVLHEGRLLVEEYRRGMLPDDRHLLQSVSKSITASLTGVLHAQGLVAPEDLVTGHVPELAGSSFDGARVRDLLDMRAGTHYDETYEDPDSDIRLSEIQFGWAPGTPPAPTTIDYLRTLHNARPHGDIFDYRSILTNVLGIVLERAAGAPMAELLSTQLWRPIGAEHDADLTVDAQGVAIMDGGLCVTARDLARFGHAVLTGGGPIPEAWIADALTGSNELRAAFAGGAEAAQFPGFHYRSKWWVPPGGTRLLGLGIHGQFLYVDRAAGIVAVVLSTWPTPLDDARHAATFDALSALSRAARR